MVRNGVAWKTKRPDQTCCAIFFSVLFFVYHCWVKGVFGVMRELLLEA